MRVARNSLLVAAAGLLASLSLTSCSYFFVVKGDGGLGEPITFQFFESESDQEPSAFDILDFTIQEQISDGQWATVWALNGEHSLSAIEYGESYEGLDEIIPAKPLSRSVQYYALASGTRWLGPGLGHAGVDFFFDEDGDLVEGTIKQQTDGAISTRTHAFHVSPRRAERASGSAE